MGSTSDHPLTSECGCPRVFVAMYVCVSWWGQARVRMCRAGECACVRNRQGVLKKCVRERIDIYCMYCMYCMYICMWLCECITEYACGRCMSTGHAV